MRLILASTSPYRRQLFARLGLPFEAVSPGFEELSAGSAGVEELVRVNTLGKARAAADRFQDACVIASDQVASCDGNLLIKPGCFEAAFRQLKMMSGRHVTFLTGLAMVCGSQEQYDVVPYHVYMRTLSDREISNYLEVERPFDCAGSFKSEGLGIALFEKMEGDDPTALIGLPLIKLSQWLQPLAGVRK